MIVFDLDGTLADCEHRRHFVEAKIILKPIPSHPRYYAGSDGNIYSYNSRSSRRTGIGIKKKAGKQKSGYLFVSLYKNDKPTYFRVHVLICESFHGPRPEGMIVSHLDDVKTNNVPENLTWETPSQNQRRKFQNGHGDDGLKNSRARIKSKEEIEMIRRLFKGGYSNAEISRLTNHPARLICNIRHGKRYAND